MRRWARHAIAGLGMALAIPAAADEHLDRVAERYRAALRDASAGELYVLSGEALFRAPRGPKQVSLERCDFGLGPGVLEGAYARLPRYFADSGKVEDLESRLMTCMTTLQGIAPDALPRRARGDARMDEFAKLAAFVASRSNGERLAAPLTHPKEIEAYRIGEYLFHRRAGPHDFSCGTCHSESGKRVRLQPLANLVDRAEARKVSTSWPAYRVAPGEVHTMQTWIATCYWATRHPQMRYGAEAAIALQVFMTRHASGGVIEGFVVVPADQSAAGRIVVFNHGDGAPRSVRTAPDGSFRLEGLAPGPWQVFARESEIDPHSWSYAWYEGDAPLEWSCHVEAGATTRFDLDLTR